MLTVGLTILSASVVVFITLLLVVQAEQKRGKRFLFGGLRGWLDRMIGGVERRVGRWSQHFSRYVIQLGWYYSLHSFLRAVLKMLVSFYERVERIFEANRKRTKELRSEKSQMTKSHLTEMAAHKEQTALTPAQQRKRKEAGLKGD